MEKAFGGAGGQFWNNPRIVAELKLTDDQRKAMDGILQEHRMKLVDLQASLKKAELGMEPLMKADTPDQAAILAQIDKVAQAQGGARKGKCAFFAGFARQADAGPVEATAGHAPEPHGPRRGRRARAAARRMGTRRAAAGHGRAGQPVLLPQANSSSASSAKRGSSGISGPGTSARASTGAFGYGRRSVVRNSIFDSALYRNRDAKWLFP